MRWRPGGRRRQRQREADVWMDGFSGLAAAAAINALVFGVPVSTRSRRIAAERSPTNGERRRVRPMAEIKELAEAEPPRRAPGRQM